MKSLNQFVHQLAGKESGLDRVRVGTRKLEALTRRIRAALPAEAREHVVGCAPRPGAVVVLADTAAWTAQLRYLQHDLLAICRQELGERIQRVQFKVLPPEPAGSVEKPPAPGISKTVRRLLQGTATGIVDDELAAALRRLSESPEADDQDAD
ncbi:MAG TPA: DciA family protein [Gammaproteobacteria bacterium]